MLPLNLLNLVNNFILICLLTYFFCTSSSIIIFILLCTQINTFKSVVIVNYRYLRTSTHGQILISMCSSLIGMYVMVIIGKVTEVLPFCGISSALLQYFLLVFFSWTAVEAVWLYFKLIHKKFFQCKSERRFLTISYLLSWGKLLIIIIIVIITAV